MPIHFFAKWASPAATAAFVVWGLLGVAAPAAAEVQTAVEYGLWTFDVWTGPAGGALPACRFFYAKEELWKLL